MAFREKHRHAALLRRVAANRPIKSDLTPAGLRRWAAAALELDLAAGANLHDGLEGRSYRR